MKIKGIVRGLSQNYADGTERQEVWFEGAARANVPMRGERAKDALVELGSETYWGTIRRTPNCSYAWLSASMTDRENAKVRLCDVLATSGFRKNFPIIFDIREDSTGSLIATCVHEYVQVAPLDGSIATTQGSSDGPTAADPSDADRASLTDLSRWKSNTDGLEKAIRALLEGGVPTLGHEYFYAHLPLCVIDAVFSVGIRYSMVQDLVGRYAEYHGLAAFREDRAGLPAETEQQSLEGLIESWKSLGSQRLATEVFSNRCRTSPRGGILKAEAVGRYAEVLSEHGIQTLQDAARLLPDPRIEKALMRIRGQGSGISTSYFLMLSGSDDHLKADRWLCRFVGDSVGRSVSSQECEDLIKTAYGQLHRDFPGLTLRQLDYAVWSQRSA